MQTQHQKYERRNKTRRNFRIGAVIALVIVGVALNRWLVSNSATVSDQAITYLTVILVFITYLQWDVMAAQNVAIEKQLDQMEREQRAWLAISANEIKELMPGAYDDQVEIDWSMVAQNTGSTPAIITHSKVDFLRKESGFDCKVDIDRIEAQALENRPRRTVVAPGVRLAFPMNDSGTTKLGEDACKEVAAHTKAAYLFGAFFYEDVFGGKHKTTCCFRYSPKHHVLTNSYQDGEMT